MILDIDAGNSCIKWRLSDQGETAQRGTVTHHENAWSVLAEYKTTIIRVRASNVAGAKLGDNLSSWIQQNIGLNTEFAVSQERVGNVTNGYSQPETLGVDRWLAVLAGWNRVRGPCLVVDAGSALTVDFVAAGGQHQGGYIVPGLRMMLASLYGGTADVRIEPDVEYSQVAGIDTKTAVQNGCFTMSAALVKTSLKQLEENEGRATLILTGGGSEPLVEFLEGRVFQVPDLVLEGLDIALP